MAACRERTASNLPLVVEDDRNRHAHAAEIPFDAMIASGMIPCCMKANQVPVRPAPDCTSSTISGISSSRVSSRRPRHEHRRSRDHATLALNDLYDHGRRQRDPAERIAQRSLEVS